MHTTLTATARLRRRGAFVVILAACALAIPASASAFYGSVSENGSGQNGSGPATAPNDSGLVIPDHTSLNESLAPVSGSTNPGGVEQPTTTPVLSPPSIGDGFDWADAALGAGATMALVALGAAGLFTVRRHTTVSPSASTS